MIQIKNIFMLKEVFSIKILVGHHKTKHSNW